MDAFEPVKIAAPSKARRRRRMALALAGAVLLGTAGTALTNALFTDTTSIPNNVFTSGTIDIDTAPTTTALTMTNMVPGDMVTAPITVKNIGNNSLRYAVTSTTTENVLAGQLVLAIKTGVTTCTNAGFGGSGTSVYSGVLGNTTPTKVIGDSATGAQAGDRTLANGTNEVLCAQVSMPSATGNAFQGLSSTATFTFNAEQTQNN